MAKKKMDAEERKEYKGGKYMGGPAEEKAEKKKGKRMFMGGAAIRDAVSRYGNKMGPAPRSGAAMPSVSMQDMGVRDRRPAPPVMRPLPLPDASNPPVGAPRPPVLAGLPPGAVAKPAMAKPAMAKRAMRGGGLAKKGVGQALAKGGLVKGAGCASRGVKKPRMV